MTTAVLEKGARIHDLGLPTGASAIQAQNQAVVAALSAEQPALRPALTQTAQMQTAQIQAGQPQTAQSQTLQSQTAQLAKTQPAAVSPTALQQTSLQQTGAMQAINMATAPQSVTKPLTDPSALSAPPAAGSKTSAGLPDDLAATYAAIPTPRPKISPAGTSTMVAYAAPGTQSLSALSRDFFPPAPGGPLPETAEASTPTLNKLIKRYAGMYGVPEALVHRVVHRESKYNPRAYNKRGFWGLMQIRYSTAKSMGYDGPAEGLLDAETNLKYAIKYLRGAWLVADNDSSSAINLYARGYYYDAKRKDMLHVMQ